MPVPSVCEPIPRHRKGQPFTALSWRASWLATYWDLQVDSCWQAVTYAQKLLGGAAFTARLTEALHFCQHQVL